MNTRRGVVFAVSAYVMWGLFPSYFRLLREVDPMHILAHRALWAGVLSAVLLPTLLRAPRALVEGRRMG